MITYIIRRFLQFIPTVIGVTLLMFVLLNVLPGNAALMVGGKKDLPPEAIAKLEKKWGLDKPVHIRYLLYIKGLLQGDLGTSFIRDEKVSRIIATRIWPTFQLALAALLISCGLGIPLGFYSALRRGTWIDTATMACAVSWVSIPEFWFGLILMFIFSVILKVLPSSGYGGGALKNLFLPALTLGVAYMALLARITRAAVLEIMSKDYIRTAHAKGLPSSGINFKHIFKNTLILILTTIGLQLGSLMGGTVIVEKLFSWPGIGSLLVDSISLRDTPITLACILLIVFTYMIINLCVDILYCIIDPQIRYD